MRTVEIKIHEIAKDGLPPESRYHAGVRDDLVGRVAFLWDGHIVTGWPLKELDSEDGSILWEADHDVGAHGKFYGVTHWIEFPVPVWDLEKS